jgi:AcrR family transcriptional regulator
MANEAGHRVGRGTRPRILAGAREVFFEVGYERAAVDAIAARAGVSKATLYAHFDDKKTLFAACAGQELSVMRNRVLTLLAAPTGEPSVDLGKVGEALLRLLLHPSTLAFRRILVAEAARFPDLGRTFYSDGPAQLRGQLAAYLRRCGGEGTLAVEDGDDAAAQFIALCVSDVLWRLELGILRRAPEALIRSTVDAAVRTFLRAYRA